MSNVMSIDYLVFQQINQLAGKWICLDSLGIFLSAYFEYFLIAFLILFLILNFKKYWKMIAMIIASVILSRLIIVELIRWILPRSRPFVENNVNLLLQHEFTPSFPSGHAAFYFAISMIIFLFLKKLKNPPKYWRIISAGFFLAAFLISLARVFVGVHWPSDVLAGALVGIFSGWLVFIFSQKYFSEVKKQLPQ